MPPLLAPQPATATMTPLMPVVFNAEAHSTVESRAQRTTAFCERLTRQYSLLPDDPIFAHLAAIQFHEESIVLLLGADEKSRSELGDRISKLLEELQTKNQALLDAIKSETSGLGEQREVARRLTQEAIEDQATFREHVGTVLSGLTKFEKNMIDADKLGTTITNATNTLTKRALWESVVSYMLPVVGALIGAIGTYVFLLKAGLILQIVPGQPAPIYQAVPSNPQGASQGNSETLAPR